jgi:hypothetical protein
VQTTAGNDTPTSYTVDGTGSGRSRLRYVLRMAKIVRPLHGRVRVWLPFRPGSGNYDLLKDMCGDLTRPEYNRDLRCFEVARAHLPTLLDRLPSELGQPVDVVLHGSSQTKCVEACWNASPDSLWECVCSCAGRFHGTRTGPPKDLGGGLAVGTDHTTNTFTVFP